MSMTNIERGAPKGGVIAAEPIAAPVPDACRMSGLSRSEIYRRLRTYPSRKCVPDFPYFVHGEEDGSEDDGAACPG